MQHKRKLGHITLLVRDYEEALNFYVGKAGFVKTGDATMGPGLRWLTVAPSAEAETKIVFVKADTQAKKEKIGNQAGDNVFLVLETDNLKEDYSTMKAQGVHFLGDPRSMPWGEEVVFEDLYGNRFDLVELRK